MEKYLSMSKNCQIMRRMKKNYETRSRTFLTRRTPVIIRLDGKAFHTYTRGLNKPFDEGLIEDMAETAKFLCSEIQGARLAYTQSDEISILLTDYDKLGTDAWFDYSVQKMTSISSSLATAKFNELRFKRSFITETTTDNLETYLEQHKILPKLAFFDSRVFNIPKEEVANYFLARQKDAVKNSVAMLAQSLYSHKELHKKNGVEMQEMIFQKGHNWNDLHWSKKRGSTTIKNTYVNDALFYLNSGYIEFVSKNLTKHMISYDSSISIKENLKKRFKNTEGYEDMKIRTKWETVETPIKFDDEYINKFI